MIFLDVDLLICKHKGPSCCTRKTEESYQVAVKRETLQNVQSYSYEPKHLFSTHANAFQGKFFDREGQARLGRPWDTELLKDKLWFNGLPWSNFWHVVLSLTEAREYPTDSAFILGQCRKKSFMSKFPFLQLFLIIWVKKMFRGTMVAGIEVKPAQNRACPSFLCGFGSNIWRRVTEDRREKEDTQAFFPCSFQDSKKLSLCIFRGVNHTVWSLFIYFCVYLLS